MTKRLAFMVVLSYALSGCSTTNQEPTLKDCKPFDSMNDMQIHFSVRRDISPISYAIEKTINEFNTSKSYDKPNMIVQSNLSVNNIYLEYALLDAAVRRTAYDIRFKNCQNHKKDGVPRIVIDGFYKPNTQDTESEYNLVFKKDGKTIKFFKTGDIPKDK